MTITPYTPTNFTNPVINPAVGGSGTPYPYVSASQYKFAPTAVDTDSLVPGGDPADQLESLADTLRRASSWADRIVFGIDPAAKSASLCATISVESGSVPLLRGELRLVCSYKPIIQVNGVDFGPTMAQLASVGNSAAAAIRIGARTIYVPMLGLPIRSGNYGASLPPISATGKYTVVWSYVNGYPHTQLAQAATAGTNTLVVLPTDGGTGLPGIQVGTQMRVIEGSHTETVTVQSTGTTVVGGVTYPTITCKTNLLFDHPLPPSPDFTPVTAMPEDVMTAVIFLTTTLIKTEGDNPIMLNEMREPRHIYFDPANQSEDLKNAMRLLKPFQIRIKGKS